MQVVTKCFDKYREASRHLRNIYYVPENSSDWDTLQDHDDMSRLLFTHLVYAHLGISFDKFDWLNEPAPIFKLHSQGIRLPLMINRKKGENSGYWDHEIKMVEPNDLEIAFISYFDWNQHGTADYRYILGRITDAQHSTSVVGHLTLVESHYVDIIYEDS